MFEISVASFTQRVDALLETLSAAYASQQLRVMVESPSLRLLQIDDYQLRLLLSTTDTGLPDLSASTLGEAEELLLSSPNAVAVVIVGSGADLPALALRLMRVRELRRNSGGIARLVARARPLGLTLHSIIDRQTRTWQVPSSRLRRESQSAPDIATLFATNLNRTIETERGRSFRVPERTVAAKELDSTDAQVVLDALRLALAGANADQLAAHLGKIES